MKLGVVSSYPVLLLCYFILEIHCDITLYFREWRTVKILQIKRFWSYILILSNLQMNDNLEDSPN